MVKNFRIFFLIIRICRLIIITMTIIASMNYLSHLFFSQHTPLSFAGNLMGDFKREPDLQSTLPVEILQGLENHRFVDKTTDHFAPVKSLRPLFSSQRRRFAGVVTDIVFDYFLIKHWHQFSQLNFNQFVDDCYLGLEQTHRWMPQRMQFVVTKMQETDWLRSYATLEGIETTIDQVSKRIRFENKMAGAIIEVNQNYAAIEQASLALFSHLKTQVNQAAIEVPS